MNQRFAFSLVLGLAFACSSTPVMMDGGPDASACSTTTTIDAVIGDGHADPTGAKAAGQARAGRIKDASMIVQPADARERARVGDFMIANDKIAAIIEDKGLSDGYARFGGEILALDRVGPDGKMIGQSRYGETLAGFAGQMIEPESVGVLSDGSDGKEAVIRVVGKLAIVPFLAAFANALHTTSWRAAMDFALAPGAEVLHLRATLLNSSDEDRQLVGLDSSMHGFFHSARGRLFTPEKGFAEPANAAWAAFEPDPGETSFAWRVKDAPLKFTLNVSGFQWFNGPQIDVPACSSKSFTFADVIVGGPGLDGLREAVRRTDALPAWRSITGTVKDAFGVPVPLATVSLQAADGSLLTHARPNAQGSFELHAPPNETVGISAYAPGYPPAIRMLAPNESTADLALGAHGTITVHATEQGTNRKVPVRVQVIPDVAVAPPPSTLGIPDEKNGRLHQSFALSGDVTLVVPPGTHRVVVTHGYEWEAFDQKVTVAAGAETVVPVSLVHSVDTTGFMCADFHIHSFYSADSDDPVVYKVQSAIADGLDIPVSSEHEWVVDFGPIVKQLGMEDWAFGMSSEELTTFAWGHFGVVPIQPKPDRVNMGAIDWIGKQPPEVFADVAALPEKPVLVVNHPSGSGGLGAYFTAAEYNRTTNKGKDPLWSDQFEAIECMNGSDFESNRNAVLADWFAMLNAGKPRTCVGNSDSHHLRSDPVGYPRTCFAFGHDDPKMLTPESVRDALRSGRSIVSGGVYMTVKGPNGEGPGQTLAAGTGMTPFAITVAAPSWVDIDGGVEVIVDGQTTGVQPLTPNVVASGKRWSTTVNVDRTGKKWVVFHVKGKGDLSPLHPGRKSFAMANPIFF